MKASEAKPLSTKELKTLRGLMRRWVLLSYPHCTGASEESDAFTTYNDISRDAEAGEMDLSHETGLEDEDIDDDKIENCLD